MKLLSCYIAGFGKFKDRAFDLSRDIVEIKEDNGWGKTTLAAFIERMLFGMDSGRTKSVSGSDRIKYEPFTGGAYGGALTLIAGGRTYRIERAFGKTPAGDTLRVYDGNNTPLAAFADGNVGERLLGVSRESFRRSAYIPQEDRASHALPDDMKSRLLSLLTEDETGGGASAALEKLDDAERALRAKRKPAKGKLDILDERLLALGREKDERLAAKDEAAATKLRISERAERLSSLSERIKTLSERIERSAREEERRAAQTAYQGLREGTRRAGEDMRRLTAFFGTNDPHAVNTDGLTGAVAEFYALKEELSENGAEFGVEKETLKIRLEALEKTIASYETVLQTERETEKKDESLRKDKRRFGGKKRKGATFFTAAGLLLALVGAVNIAQTPALGYVLFFVGLAGLGFGLFRMLASMPPRKRRGGAPSAVREEYERAIEEAEALKARIALAEQGDGEGGAAQKRERMNALETAIKRFLENFRFDEPIYDYRAAARTLRENIARYGECERVLSSATAEPPAPVEESEETESAEALKRALREAEREKETLTAERARLAERLQAQETLALSYYDLVEEEARLLAEKRRLEKRLTAIRGARELLLRARENMASRYLVPVQRLCREYLQIIGYAKGEALRFTADGAPLIEEAGGMREAAYYSAGSRELIGLCTRLALVRLVFVKEAPPLVLDDPLVDLDDEKTARAKRLLSELSKNYQILYFTCKQERRLGNR